jgi:hypothetical protein
MAHSGEQRKPFDGVPGAENARRDVDPRVTCGCCR